MSNPSNRPSQSQKGTQKAQHSTLPPFLTAARLGNAPEAPGSCCNHLLKRLMKT
jgi:hypothetical protein